MHTYILNTHINMNCMNMQFRTCAKGWQATRRLFVGHVGDIHSIRTCKWTLSPKLYFICIGILLKWMVCFAPMKQGAF